MFVSSRIAKTLAATFIGAALVLCAGIALAQISGTIGGDLVAPRLIEDEGFFFAVPRGAVVVPRDEIAAALNDGTSNVVIIAEEIVITSLTGAPEGPRPVRVTADVTTTDAAGIPRPTRIIAILIGLFAPRAPGLTDYALDACHASDGGAATDAEWRSCTLVARRFSAFLEARRRAVSPAAVMAPTARGIAIWDPR
jgi:hypothetical protein